ncbi:MAG: nucleotidyltransferase domain-containing protein [Spirochaetes bacterium]|jgi:predicted nucleotidyltransferase|nr:nucleotidyltransferase domain-containing protein [Spirochaetota bacterium]
MDEIEKKILLDFKRAIGERLPVTRIILFGSRARGDADIDSDMDVLVVIDTDDIAGARRIASECAWESSLGTGIVLSPVVSSAQNWEYGPERMSLLSKAVRSQGIPV